MSTYFIVASSPVEFILHHVTTSVLVKPLMVVQSLHADAADLGISWLSERKSTEQPSSERFLVTA